MVCGNCGRVVKDGAKFCDYCGATVNAATAGAEQSGEQILGGAKRRGKGLVVGLGVAGVAVVAAVAILLVSLLGGAKGKVLKAAAKSAGEHAAVMDTFGVSTLREILEKQAYTQKIGLELEKLSVDDYSGNDYSIMKGLGADLILASDLPGHKIGVNGMLRWGSVDLVEAYVTMEEGKIIAFCPELMDDTALGIDTETIGKDISEADWFEDFTGEDMDDFEDLSFNIFDLIDITREVTPMDTAAQKELVNAIEVEKDGSDEVEVNGEDIKCAIYSVVIPEDALLDYLDALQEYVEESTKADEMADYLDSLDLDIDTDDFADEMESSYDEVFSTLEEAVKELGDLEFEVAVKGGLVMAVNGELEIDGETMEYSLQLGGGKEYVNDISLTMEVDGSAVVIESSGDHALKGGVYTDTTTFKADGEKVMTIETEYDTKAKDDNFSFVMFNDEGRLTLEGTLAVSGGSFSMVFDELSFFDDYNEGISVSGEYTVKAYEKIKIPAEETVMLLTADEGDIEDLLEDIEDNAYDFGMYLGEECYELIEAIQYWS